MAKFKMAARILKNIHLTHKFTIMLDRDMRDKSVLMFSGMCNRIIAFLLKKNHRRSTFLQIQTKITGYYCKLLSLFEYSNTCTIVDINLLSLLFLFFFCRCPDA